MAIKSGEGRSGSFDVFLGVKISAADKVLLDEIVKATGITQSQIVRIALRRFLGVEPSESPGDDSP